MSTDNTADKVKGVAKEVAGKATGSDELAREGEAQQQKAAKREEAERLEREADVHEAEERAHQG